MKKQIEVDGTWNKNRFLLLFNSVRHSYFPSMAWRSLCLVSIFRHSTCSCSSLSLGNSSGCSRRCRAFRMRWAILSWPRLVATSRIYYQCFMIPIGWVFNWISWSPSAIWPRILTASKSRVLGAAWSNNWKEITTYIFSQNKRRRLWNFDALPLRHVCDQNCTLPSELSIGLV